MTVKYGSRDLVRNPSLLRVRPDESFIVEDKKSHKDLGVYIGTELAKDFFDYLRKRELLRAAARIRESAQEEHALLEASVDDGL